MPGAAVPGERSSMDKEKRLYDGYCEFCGQVVQYDEETLHEAKGDPKIAAKLICECAEAELYKTRRKNIIKGVERVDKIIGRKSENPASDETIAYLHRAVTNIVDREMRKVTIQISNIEKVTVAATKKGIKVSREIKQTNDSEIELLI